MTQSKLVKMLKIFLVQTAGMVIRKNREVKNSCGIEERSVSGNCKDDFVKKYGRYREVKVD